MSFTPDCNEVRRCACDASALPGTDLEPTAVGQCICRGPSSQARHHFCSTFQQSGWRGGAPFFSLHISRCAHLPRQQQVLFSFCPHTALRPCRRLVSSPSDSLTAPAATTRSAQHPHIIVPNPTPSSIATMKGRAAQDGWHSGCLATLLRPTPLLELIVASSLLDGAAAWLLQDTLAIGSLEEREIHTCIYTTHTYITYTWESASQRRT
ncbi:hypothetical protein K437DRAFT_34335 [Tilletiaria anomala UBC 951]|uniref:Uncharacterized protein n=1 Tax=Tilletiaria anomala (strain ATCC 24038 / CBS 436.72 / UBC 951) TaxID=1037660 RepID=A0A066WE01_TILAU|nr:uncharacterized protein K437DRAFT_34335 [Tilletiaria anomala UBC 951]KDN52182.1 hypothetical protein K437DRAFT_34335 [Tilletiaria anomala UBC 951]